MSRIQGQTRKTYSPIYVRILHRREIVNVKYSLKKQQIQKFQYCESERGPQQGSIYIPSIPRKI